MSIKADLARTLVYGALFVSVASAALAQDPVSLFKVITTKDDIVVGFSTEELSALGGDNAGFVGRALVANGELTAWQFAVRRGSDGELEQAPLRLISILAHDSLRIEPYATPLRIVPIEQ